MNRKVNLTKRVQTAGGMRYCPVVFAATGRVKPDAVLVNGKQEIHKEGAYYLEWRAAGKRIRVSVGENPVDAHARWLRKAAELDAVNKGAVLVPEGRRERRKEA
jgi:integrase/recombinase XerD